MSTMKPTSANRVADENRSSAGLVAVLNELIAMCHNGENGYQLACDRVDSDVLRGLFEAYSRQRREFAEALRQEVSRLGGTPEMGGDLAGTFHRLWIRLKRTFAAGDAAIVAECLTGEAAALEVYEEARQGMAASPLEDLVEQQYEGIRAAHDRLRALQAGGQFHHNGHRKNREYQER